MKTTVSDTNLHPKEVAWINKLWSHLYSNNRASESRSIPEVVIFEGYFVSGPRNKYFTGKGFTEEFPIKNEKN